MEKVFFFKLLISGAKLPFKLYDSAMVTSPSGKGVVIIGGWNGNKNIHSNALLELKDISKEWVPLKQTLQHSRDGHVAIPIPNDWTFPNTDEMTTQNQQHDRKWKAPYQQHARNAHVTIPTTEDVTIQMQENDCPQNSWNFPCNCIII